MRHFWVHFDLSVTDDLSVEPAPFAIKLSPAERDFWRSLHEHARVETGVGLSRLRHACAGAIWVALSRTELLDRPPPSPRLRALLSWIDHRLAQPPSLAAMAAEAGLGPRAFSRWFVRETGRTPVDFLTDRRVREACRRLRFTADSIEQIAAATGFANRHHFSRVFRQRTGRGPARYRSSVAP